MSTTNYDDFITNTTVSYEDIDRYINEWREEYCNAHSSIDTDDWEFYELLQAEQSYLEEQIEEDSSIVAIWLWRKQNPDLAANLDLAEKKAKEEKEEKAKKYKEEKEDEAKKYKEEKEKDRVDQLLLEAKAIGEVYKTNPEDVPALFTEFKNSKTSVSFAEWIDENPWLVLAQKRQTALFLFKN